MSMKPNCHECIHRGEVPGDAHICCRHPKANISFLVGVGNPLGIKGNAHGIRHGWFMWPMNFDPVWLEACNGFEARKEVKADETNAAQ
jgi:hypothetical protein